MIKPPGNTKVLELTASSTRRSISLDRIKPIMNEKGEKHCAWCATERLVGRRKYCSDVCSNSAMAWFYPQKEWALFILLTRQDWRCKACQHDWRPEAQLVHDKLYKGYEAYGPVHKLGEKFDWGVVTRLKGRLTDRKPEVDHVIPIYKGGQSLGLDNHQAICHLCHKAKTSVDLSGKRTK